MLYYNPQAVVQVNGKCSGSFMIEQSFLLGCPLSALLYVHAWEPLLRSLMDERSNTALCRVPFVGDKRAKVSPYVGDITVFVSCLSDMKAAKKVIVRYKKIAGALKEQRSVV